MYRPDHDRRPQPASKLTQPVDVALAQGDGIGPEITDAVCRILDAAGARVRFVPVTMGERCYLDGVSSGIPAEAWDVIRKHGVLLKGPITTPQGGGYKSLNVTLRKALGLFANVRPCRAWHPWIETRHPDMDVLIVRENEEDTYAGIEHRQTNEVTQCLKLISSPGSERLIRYAFELARAQGRKRVDCFSKDNIMKLTDGLFHRIFDRVAEEYPDIESGHMIIDIGTALLADRPERFDVIVAPNLYGDIISDVAAQITGSVGLGGSANIGEGIAMFEAVHGSAPDIAGQDLANPSGLLLAAIEMLRYIGDGETANRVFAAWTATLADGLHTADIHRPGHSRERLGTRAFADAVIERLDESSEAARQAEATAWPNVKSSWPEPARAEKTLIGVDVFLDWDQADRDPKVLGEQVRALDEGLPVRLSLITNRGVKVFPEGLPETRCTDHWRCRFRAEDGQTIEHKDVIALLQRFADAGLDFIKTEQLYAFDGVPGFSLGQGE
ncbi:NADP-dependent isocitrate dehydrogenase [Wenzhouxiangella marina]|uniref:Isocitrate dehydrogenase [NADP] n=1 Tax=Wenzhouxiangella marina TaxID=1579979 RepID=A0A0K0XSN9_9GAMM|nr:NADP-dependent isocitrate dehydrogenase [Wenzhouxiangella marina]AKS40647.1 Isocitrate dehydrogenase [Wenzhouxiangella marina]MBB6088417.1 isocitrate dehydrogenase [Wenzhouxiangella marina]